MNWKNILRKLERGKQWDDAIEFMEQIIAENPDDMDAYMLMNYLLMNLLIEERYHDTSKDPHYRCLSYKYFKESYAKFSHNAEYLYLTGRTAVMAEMLWGIDVKDYEQMLEKAMQLEPNNWVYKETYYWKLSEENPQDPELDEYAKIVLTEPSPVTEQLKDKGALGEYLLMMKREWVKPCLHETCK